MTDITIVAMEPSWFAVHIREGHETTSHRVQVPEDFALDMGVGGDVDDEALVRESVGFLLEKEPATAIRREFRLDEIGGYFPDYADELRARLTAGAAP